VDEPRTMFRRLDMLPSSGLRGMKRYDVRVALSMADRLVSSSA
jgi:hypothetical protein